MTRAPQVLAIGLDAGEPALIREWARGGYLPNLRRVLETGVVSDLTSVGRHFPDVVWPAVYTSRGPARFEPYFFIRPKPGTAHLEVVGHTLSGADPFWVTAARHGRRCAVVDAPKIGIHAPANGMQLAGWGAHSTLSELASHPAELATELVARHGRYPMKTCDDHGPSLQEYARMRRLMLDGVAARRRLYSELLAAQPWHLFFACFSETHCAGHQFWHLQDRNHPRHPGYDHDLQCALRDVYQAVDQAIGALIAVAGEGTHVVICSGHGMQPEYHGREMVPTLLQWWGMRGPSNVAPDASRERTNRVPRSVLDSLRARVPLRWQYVVKRRLPKSIEYALMCRFVGAQRLDVQARAFYVPNNDLNPALRINVRGRDPFGTVAAGDEYNEVREFLLTRLRELINPDTGRPALDEVSAIHECYEGEFLSALPDIIGFWNRERFIDALYSPGYGTLRGGHRDHRSGGHAAQGFLAMSLSDGATPSLSGGDIMDIAPTILRLLDVPIPNDMEGRPRVTLRSA